jgi:hypothetical protein
MIRRFELEFFKKFDETGTGVGKQIDVDRLGWMGYTQKRVYLTDE